MERKKEKVVRRHISIPKWMDDDIRKRHLNFSKWVQDKYMEEFGKPGRTIRAE